MDSKRYMMFVAISVAIFATYYLVMEYVVPKPPPKPVAEAEDIQPEDAEAPLDNEPEVDGEPATDDASTDNQDPENPDADKPNGAEIGPAEPEKPEEFIALGSLDPESGYRFLVTFTTQGAAIERLELSDPNYKDLENRAGYLGFLSLSDAPEGGCLVNVNVKETGSPAALAGIEKGDIIEMLGGTPTPDRAAFIEALSNTRPRDEVVITLRKAGEEKSSDVTATLIRQPLEVIRPDPLPYAPGSTPPPSFRATIVSGEGIRKGLSLKSLIDGQWDLVKPADDKQPLSQSELVVFRRDLSERELKELKLTGDWRVEKRYRLVRTVKSSAAAEDAAEAAAQRRAEQAYHLEMELELFNKNTEGEAQLAAFLMHGPNGLPWEGWWYSNKISPGMFSGAGARDIAWSTTGGGHQLLSCQAIFSNTLENTQESLGENTLILPQVGENAVANTELHYIGVDTQYFCSAMLPGDEQDLKTLQIQRSQAYTVGPVTAEDKPYRKRINVSFNMYTEPQSIAPGESMKQSFVIYAGPKVPEILADYGLSEFIYYGWFSLVSKPLMYILHFFQSIIGSYGLAIILLTLLVRGIMYPFSRSAAKGQLIMQQIKPEMDAMRKKYENDMEKMGQAQRELFKKYNYNPLSGCWIMFLQLPIFLGLYRALSVDIALRDQPLIAYLPWCTNLAAPDKLLYWGTWPEFLLAKTGYLGPYLNILPLVTVALFMTQQKLFTPPATDEQSRMTQKMMSYMTLFIGVMFFKVPAGLCLYFITSSLWGIIERKLIPRPTLDGKEKSALTTTSKTDNAANGAAERAKERKRKMKKGK